MDNVSISKNKFIILILCWFIPIFSSAKNDKNVQLISPINMPFNLAGTFGEPRLHHFHSGIDIKTNGKEGYAVKATADGYISRILVSPYGYGKAIYITHFNGYTSVYGHLSSFYGNIGDYIHQQLYSLNKNELNLYLESNQFPVKQGDTIAYSGNTGGSTAPHLHFEIRNTKTELVVNPLDFFPDSMYIDSLAPTIIRIKLMQEKVDTAQYIDLINKGDYWTSIHNINVQMKNRFCFSLDGFDKQNETTNKNGIKKIEVYKDHQLTFTFDVTSVNFSNTRMCDAFVDYDELSKDKGYFYNCFQLKGNTLPIYSHGNGFFMLQEKDSSHFIINCYDYANNKTEIRLTFIAQGMKNEHSSSSKNQKMYCVKDISKPTAMATSTAKINFPSYSFYDKTCLIYQENKRNNLEQLSNRIKIISPYKEIPLLKPARINIQSNISINKNKIIIVRENADGSKDALTTIYSGNTFSAYTKDLGTFYLEYDTIAPTISIQDLDTNTLSIKAVVKDNLSGIKKYNGYIDGKWINLYFDAKNDIVKYKLDEYCTTGTHTFMLNISDEMGNTATASISFFRE
ncbi:MAG: M23 family metallopeptidase [Bacteroidetes bacterium]|nr:M23 family metallopeptidase [Bacteroidota bacterium]